MGEGRPSGEWTSGPAAGLMRLALRSPSRPPAGGPLSAPRGVSASIYLAAGSFITWRETQARRPLSRHPHRAVWGRGQRGWSGEQGFWGAVTPSLLYPGAPATCPTPSPNPSCSWTPRRPRPTCPSLSFPGPPPAGAAAGQAGRKEAVGPASPLAWAQPRLQLWSPRA